MANGSTVGQYLIKLAILPNLTTFRLEVVLTYPLVPGLKTSYQNQMASSNKSADELTNSQGGYVHPILCLLYYVSTDTSCPTKLHARRINYIARASSQPNANVILCWLQQQQHLTESYITCAQGSCLKHRRVCMHYCIGRRRPEGFLSRQSPHLLFRFN